MAGERDGPVRTVLRGEALRQQLESSGQVSRVSAPATTRPPVATRDGQGKLINGVPASAAIHCCGRGCAHCRIYWRKSDV